MFQFCFCFSFLGVRGWIYYRGNVRGNKRNIEQDHSDGVRWQEGGRKSCLEDREKSRALETIVSPPGGASSPWFPLHYSKMGAVLITKTVTVNTWIIS